MASKQSLRRIGEEGFRMIDQAAEGKQRCLYHPTKPSVHYLQPPPVAQVHRILKPQFNHSQYQHQKPETNHQVSVTEQATSLYNQPRISTSHTHVSPSPRDPTPAVMMDCYEAARQFGCMVVTDYCPSKKVMMQRNTKTY